VEGILSALLVVEDPGGALFSLLLLSYADAFSTNINKKLNLLLSIKREIKKNNLRSDDPDIC